MEGLVQAFKAPIRAIQREICVLVGKNAKRRGQEWNAWKETQTLYWDGVACPRESSEYQQLLDRAFDALFTNKNFRNALAATGDEPLTYSIGNPDPKQTILTEKELVTRLTRLRTRIKLFDLGVKYALENEPPSSIDGDYFEGYKIAKGRAKPEWPK